MSSMEPEWEWKPIEPSQDELDFMKHQRDITRRIVAIFGLSLKDLGIIDVVDGSIIEPITDKGKLLKDGI